MAPPDRGDAPRDTSVIDSAGIDSTSRLRHNAERLTSWLEFLLHPEEHEYDRTVIYPDGGKREEPGPVAPPTDQPGTVPSDAQLPFESVLEGYQPWQFIHGMSAVATPEVERPESPLGLGAAALMNVWWIGDEAIPSLVDAFPDIKWEGDAGDAAHQFLLRLQTVASQINKLSDQLLDVLPKYAALVKGVRDNLDAAAAGLVKAFEKKFREQSESGTSIDIPAAVLAGIAGALVATASGGTALIVGVAATSSTWSTLFTDVAGDLLKEGAGDPVNGYWWRDLAKSYLHKQEEILTTARSEMDKLDRTIKNQIERFANDEHIKQFLAVYGS